MTVAEFNEKYKDYLEKGHYGLAIEHKEIVAKLDKIFEDCIKIPGFKYYQIKEKFGLVRVYTSLVPEANYNIETIINKLL